MNEKPTNDTANDDTPAQDSGESSAAAPQRREGGLRKLRVWPVLVLLVGLWATKLVPGLYAEMSMPVMMLGFAGPSLFTLLILLWWLLLSRASWQERIAGTMGLILLMIAANILADASMQGFGIWIYAMPWAITVFALVLVALARLDSRWRTWLALAATMLCFGYWDLVRTDEIWGNFQTARSWRWEPTAEEEFLERLAARPSDGLPAEPAGDKPLPAAEWPEFRGPARDGVLPGVYLAEDWEAEPPREIWRIPIGPGWSSFSVAGDRLFTQEQRGDQEVVSCYDTGSGAELWARQNEARFWEPVGGAGPRATPTVHDGKLFALGATGLLQRLDPLTGRQVWQRDLNQDSGREPPQWGYASSPLVAGDVVIVHAGGPGDQGLLAYDLESGEPRWSCPSGDHSYSSPQLAELDGTTCVLMLTNQGLDFVDPEDGNLLGQHAWEFAGYRVVQPLVLDSTSVLLGTPMGTGTRRIDVSRSDTGFSIKESWTTPRMNPYYNDYVAHEGYLYGFDNNIFACVDLADGKRKWKQGRYGNGQVLLLPEGNQLLLIAEDGELVLLRATPESHIVVARHQVLEGRTWNHPVLIGNRLYVRNGEQAACFELPLFDGTAPVPQA